MAGKLKNVRVVTFSEDFGRYKKGKHAMHESVAEILEKQGAKIKVAKVDKEEMVKTVKSNIAKANKKAKELEDQDQV
jgi:hypothetical protein